MGGGILWVGEGGWTFLWVSGGGWRYILGEWDWVGVVTRFSITHYRT